MRGTKPAMRRSILRHLVEHLKVMYDLELPVELLSTGTIPDSEIDALVAFRSDAKLDELREALARLEDGSFGTCLACKAEMNQALLDHDPTVRFCTECERNFRHHRQRHMTTHAGVS